MIALDLSFRICAEIGDDSIRELCATQISKSLHLFSITNIDNRLTLYDYVSFRTKDYHIHLY